MKIVRPQVLYIAALIIIMCFIIWVTSLFFAYLGDDWHSPAADEKSVPASRDY